MEPPPKDQAFIIFDPMKTCEDAIIDAIIELGYDVKEVVYQD